jgi:uncharacterized protein
LSAITNAKKRCEINADINGSFGLELIDMLTPETIIVQTKKWITDVVIGCNFCPFAAREVKKNSIHYEVTTGTTTEESLKALFLEFERLDAYENIETSFLIFPDSFEDFHDYLDLVSLAEKLLYKEGYEGIYQIASFHPAYCFAGSDEDDAANYTNRSPYPMLHLLREESMEKALENFSEPESIPEKNIAFAREKGTAWMKMLRDKCF